ncbi:hypothetical protein [Sutcliffiella cohnii]|uniref:hypothetical protein n=1 Tax=Sutcliffiella cohnii TaxID=33932 RepID=UPI002E24FDF6|nr:hypothetical protein [Sutcliffiella cohnii]
MKKYVMVILILIIAGCSLSDENAKNFNQTNTIIKYFYYLDDITTEIFVSKKDAKEWIRYYEENNKKKLEEATLNNVVKGLEHNIDIDSITNNEIKVISCDEGLCEILTENSYVFKAFVVPKARIMKETEMANSENQGNDKVNTNKDLFWNTMNTQITGILDETSELIQIYESSEYETIRTDSSKTLYDSVNGRVNILRHTLLPEDPELERQYYQILMAAEFLFNTFHQAKLYIETNQMEELNVLIEEEIIPLREELKVLTDSGNT